MRAMILAAGRGERMGALTETIPKPLLQVSGHYLIEYVIARLKLAGITEIVINISYLALQIKSSIGNGEKYGVNIMYSEEADRLETGGGILQALPLLGSSPFLVVSADILTDFAFQTLPKEPNGLAHLVLVDNPDFHSEGDFGLQNTYVNQHAVPKFTFANIGIFRPELFKENQKENKKKFPLRNLLLPAIANQQITGEYFNGIWYNIGTPNELAKAEKAASLLK
jgi:MurNAc alpha-1-phosphate uridylyltransferase